MKTNGCDAKILLFLQTCSRTHEWLYLIETSRDKNWLSLQLSTWIIPRIIRCIQLNHWTSKCYTIVPGSPDPLNSVRVPYLSVLWFSRIQDIDVVSSFTNFNSAVQKSDIVELSIDKFWVVVCIRFWYKWSLLRHHHEYWTQIFWKTYPYPYSQYRAREQIQITNYLSDEWSERLTSVQEIVISYLNFDVWRWT